MPHPPTGPDTTEIPKGGLESTQHLPKESASRPVAVVEEKESPKSDGQPNAALDSFDSVMAAMDAELARIKGPSAPARPDTSSSSSKTSKPTKKKPEPLPKLPTKDELDDLDEDTLAAMDRELKAALKQAGVEDSDEEDIEEAGQLDEDGKREYEMMKSFLESYRSQGGQSGVVGNLFGRLGQGAKK